MNVVLVLTVIGRDRPGLVERLAALVADHGGNWLESRMSRLGGEFAGILRLTLPAPAEPAFLANLANLQSSGLTTLARRDDSPDAPTTPGRLIHIDLVGQDRPGIVRQISAALAARAVNVEELTTERLSAPMSGEPIFKAKARVSLPPSTDIADLRQTLEAIAADLLVDLSLAPVNQDA